MAKNIDCCADCSCAAPAWASVNRGIFLCDDCGSIHRTLGRHVSIVKSLKRGTWPTSLLNLIKELHASGSNEIWEHQLLLDSSTATTSQLGVVVGGGSRKPMPNDSASKKQEFIQSKHRYLSFVQRIDKSSRSTQEALNEDLYNVVRTGAVKDSLRYIVLGADPNWIHPQKKMRTLHTASRSGQASQVELLLLWGADPLLEDQHGQQAAELALGAGHESIALRLQEAAFEVPDRLTCFITNGRRPDHAHGIHFLEPELSDVSLVNDDQRQARKLSQAALKALGNDQLKNLSNDIHDEVDRRELDEQFAARNNRHQHASATISPHGSTPFLPVDPRFSPVRNQARQKLALLNAREFVWLIVDLLGEIRRRYGHQQAVELVKISTKLLSRNSGGSQKDAALSSNEFSTTERSPQQYNGATLNINGLITYGSTGRGGKVGARLRELPSTVSSSDGYGEQADDSAISDRQAVTDGGNELNTDAEENELPDYDDVEDAAEVLLPHVAAVQRNSGVAELRSVHENVSLSAAASVTNGHKPPLAVRARGGASSASPRVTGEQLKSHSRQVAKSGSHTTSEGDALAAMMAQVLGAISGLREDFKTLSKKVDIIWEERNATLIIRSMPTQAVLSEFIVKLTKQIHLLKLASEADDLLAVGAPEAVMQYCTDAEDAVKQLVDSFPPLSSTEQTEFSNLRMCLSNISESAAELVLEGASLAKLLDARSKVCPDNQDSVHPDIVQQKKVVMDVAYMVAKHLRSLHKAYSEVMEENSPPVVPRSSDLVRDNDGLPTESQRSTTGDSSHYAVIMPAGNK